MEATSNRKNTATGLQSSLDNTVERVAASAHDTVDRVAGAASSATKQIGRKGDELLKTKDRYVDVAADQVRDHPFAALGVAAAAAFLVTLLLTRR